MSPPYTLLVKPTQIQREGTSTLMGARQAHGKAWGVGDMAAIIFGKYSVPQRTVCPTSSSFLLPSHLTPGLGAGNPQGEPEVLKLNVWE